MDNVSWLALAAALSLLGAVATVVLWRRRGAASGLRALAWTLLPGAAYLTGTLRLLGEVAGAVASWAAGLVFNPLMWLGISVAGVAVVLFGVSGSMRRRGVGTRNPGAGGRRAVEQRKDGGASPPARSSGQEPDDDMADIEAILRKHGIS